MPRRWVPSHTARAASGPIKPHLGAFLQSLVVAEVSDVYRANADRAIRRLCDELGLETLRDLCRDKVEPWFAKAIADDMGAATRNYYRQSIVSFANWLAETKRIRTHDLASIPVADRRLDPRRQRRLGTVVAHRQHAVRMPAPHEPRLEVELAVRQPARPSSWQRPHTPRKMMSTSTTW